MEEVQSFTGTLSNLKSTSGSKRDPRHLRLAATTDALTEVIEGEVTPAKVFASALSTLEGTLHQEISENALDSVLTQTALLEVIRMTLPHVPSGVAGATIASTTKILRYVLSFCKSVAVNNDSGKTVMETKDELGGITSLVCKTCQVAAEFTKRLPESTSEKNVKAVIQTFFFTLFSDPRAKVKKTATNELCGILSNTSVPCHGAVSKETTSYVCGNLDKITSKRFGETQKKSLLDLLDFVQASIMLIDFSAAGSKLMILFLKVMGEVSSNKGSDFIAKKHDASEDIAIINAMLSTILAMLEYELSDAKAEELSRFAARVLASLVQEKPTLTFAYGTADEELLISGRTVYGQVMLSSCQRLIENKDNAGFKLLPLTIQQLLNLSKAHDLSSTKTFEGTVMTELGQLVRIHLGPLSTVDPTLFNSCSHECLNVLQNLLSPAYQHTWSVSLLTLAILLQQMDPKDEAVRGCVQALVKARCNLKHDKTLEDSIDGAIRSLVQGIGIQNFWEQIDLTQFCMSQGKQSQMHWLFDAMKSSGNLDNDGRLELEFFRDKVLHLARQFDMNAVNSPEKAPMLRGQVVDLWALLPAFCRYPSDIAASFPNLAPLLMRAMNDNRYPQLVTIISESLSILVAGVCSRFELAQELERGEEDVSARTDAETVRGLLDRLLPALFKLIDSLHTKGSPSPADADAVNEKEKPELQDNSTQVQAVTGAIASMARLSPAPLLNTLSSKLIQKLLEASQSNEDLSVKVCSLLTLAQALVISETLEESTISLLYRSLKPLIRTDETAPKVQKRAYKLLAEICSRYDGFVSDKDTLKELIDLLTSTSGTSQTSARSARLKCLSNLVNSFDDSQKQNKQTTASIIGEVLLCLKDSNTKTRDSAYKLLLSIVRVQGSSELAIQAIAACMASNTSHMRSASVMALSRLVFECAHRNDDAMNDDDDEKKGNDEKLLEYLPSLLKTILVLADDPSREVFKSVVGFVRVYVGVATVEQLEPMLGDILGTLLKYHRGKDRFRAKIKIIIKKLVKYFGYEALYPFVPASDTRLLTHMKKLSERELRRKRQRREQQQGGGRVPSSSATTKTRTNFDDMIGSDEEDSDDGRTLLTAATRMSRMTKQSSQKNNKRGRDDYTNDDDGGKSAGRSSMYSSKTKQSSVRIKNDLNGEVQDMTDLTQAVWNVDDLPSDESDDDDDDDDAVHIDDSGMIVVRDDDDDDKQNAKKEESLMMQQDLVGLKRHKLNDAKSVSSNKKNNNNNNNDNRKGKGKQQKQLGAAYKARKAGGDAKKKGQKYDPYAYVPLDGRSYTKKNRRNAVEQMGTVVNRGRKRQRR